MKINMKKEEKTIKIKHEALTTLTKIKTNHQQLITIWHNSSSFSIRLSKFIQVIKTTKYLHHRLSKYLNISQQFGFTSTD